MPDKTERNDTPQPRSRLKGIAKNTVKRLDFGMRRPMVKKPAAKSAVKPVVKPVEEPVVKPVEKLTAKPTPGPEKPARPVRPVRPARPVESRGRFMDFAPSRPAKKPVSRVEATFEEETITVKTTPKPAPKPAPKPEPVVRRVKPTPIARPARPARPATSVKPRPAARPDISAARPTRRPARPAAPAYDEFDEELDALDSISDDIFGDIDVDRNSNDIDAIEREIEAEVNDFVSSPKPLFEDPLVKLSKARDERRHKKEAKAAAEFKEQKKEEAKKASYLAPYTLGGRSPFLTSVNVEKRPLSSGASVADGPFSRTAKAAGTTGSASVSMAGSSAKASKSGKSDKSSRSGKTGKTSRFSRSSKFVDRGPVELKAPGSALTEDGARGYRSLMSRQLDQDAKEIHRQAMLASTSDEKKHRPGLIIAVILTVLLGAGVGAVIYLIFFQ